MGRPRKNPDDPKWRTATANGPTEGRVLVAIESFACHRDGADWTFVAGQTLIREGHPWLRGIEHLFEPVTPQFDIEQATAAPGEVRER